MPISKLGLAIVAATALSTTACQSASAPPPSGRVVTLKSGAVEGVVSGEATAFRGIRYAAAPSGALRFAPPSSPPSWPGVRVAAQSAPACPQKGLTGGVTGEDDCLAVDVYTPSGVGPGDRLPVMVWFHGGNLVTGRNADYDASVIAERQKVIVVTANYRLGALGFMAHPALRGPGEGAWGLQDQQAALRWVRDNVPAFGGDPGRVTIFGESAGSFSVCLHLVAPASRGLFHGAIMQSGVCTTPNTPHLRDNAEAAGLKLAAELGCSDPATARACLLAIDPEAWAKAVSRRPGTDDWNVMVGGDVLPRSARESFAQGDFARVPIMMGSNHDEGRLFTNFIALTKPRSSREDLENGVRGFVGGGDPEAALSQYPADGKPLEIFADVVTDSLFACPMLTMNRLVAGRTPIYAYEFQDPQAPAKMPRIPWAPPLGAFHAAEITYIFQQDGPVGDAGKFSPAQRRLAQRMQDAWGSFAREGAPAATPAWGRFDGAQPYLLSPTQTGVVTDFASRHRCGFWNGRGN